MKKLSALIAVLSFLPLAHAYADGSDITASGDYRLQYQDYQNSGGDHSADDSNFHQRFRLGVNARANEKMNAHITLVGNTDWGSSMTQNGMTTLNANSAGDINNMVLVNEAYATWVLNDNWVLRVGRGAFTMGDGRFISSNDWENVQTAFDGVMATWDQDWGRTSFFGVKGAVDSGYPNNTIDSRFYGVSEDLKNLPTFLKMVNIHVLQVYQDQGTYNNTSGVDLPNNLGAFSATTTLPYRDETRAGFTVSGDKANVDYRLDGEVETGKYMEPTGTAKENLTAHMVDADLGYTFPSLMNGRVHIGYHQDSGNNNTTNSNDVYDSFAYDRHDNGGLMNIFGWGNLTYTWFGVSAQPRDDITVAADYYMFSKTDAQGVVMSGDYGYYYSTIGGANTTSGTLGNELDLTVTKHYGQKFYITGLYGMFDAGSAYSGLTTTSGNSLKTTVTEYYLEGGLTF